MHRRGRMRIRELSAGASCGRARHCLSRFDMRDRKDEGAEIEELPWTRAELSEAWWSVIYGYTDVRVDSI